MLRDWRLYWDDILIACRKILRFVAGLDQTGFRADERTYDAVLRNLEVIGKAVTPTAGGAASAARPAGSAGLRSPVSRHAPTPRVAITMTAATTSHDARMPRGAAGTAGRDAVARGGAFTPLRRLIVVEASRSRHKPKAGQRQSVYADRGCRRESTAGLR